MAQGSLVQTKTIRYFRKALGHHQRFFKFQKAKKKTNNILHGLVLKVKKKIALLSKFQAFFTAPIFNYGT